MNRLTVSFDLDGVIMQNPFDDGVFPWVRQHVRSAVPALSSLNRHEADSRMTETVTRIFFKRMLSGDLVSSYDWDAILNEASTSLDGPAVPDVAGLVERFCTEDGMIRTLPNATAGLQLLRENGVQTVALTNGYYRFQWPVLVALGIEHYFDSVHSPESLGFAKPQSGAFHAIPGLSAHVGDTLVHDVLGANLAGVTSIWMNPLLPAELAPLTPAERVHEPVFRDFLQQDLNTSPYLQVHPEATVETVMPDMAVLDVLEAARAILEQAADQQGR